ncbi:MAG: hypothetical protein HYT75_00110 [Deltaproteobacteria bacterium]|nr:hypothetical protein [Deltaproteobacteria bacterium]MBI2342377.1 hypothetical protein [Deltaproteobacteria bacterium]
MGVEAIAKQRIPETNVDYVDADNDGAFNPCDGSRCDYYEADGHRLATNDPLVKDALYDYQMEVFSGGMRNLGFVFDDMRKILSSGGEPSIQADAATAVASIQPENVLALPLLEYVVANESGEFDEQVINAARESIMVIDWKDF